MHYVDSIWGFGGYWSNKFIGSRRELFVDDYLIERMENARRVLHQPAPQEVSLVRNKPWEGNVSGYTTVFQDAECATLRNRI